MDDYRNPYQDRRIFLLGAPFVGGLLGGLVGSALIIPCVDTQFIHHISHSTSHSQVILRTVVMGIHINERKKTLLESFFRFPFIFLRISPANL